jgi:hypothetical protein
MESRSDFEYYFEDDILKIIDLDLGNITVTNDIENVLTDIRKIEGDKILTHRIQYMDSEGNWDFVTPTWDGLVCNYVRFF